MNPFNLFIIGYRCTGKSSVGKILAAKLGRSFVDTDSRVVAESGMSIKELVNSQSWGAFRRLEHGALKEICALTRQVVATGGGIVLNSDNIDLMKKSGKAIWLKATVETIKLRMKQDQASKGFRPALTSKGSYSEIKEILMERKPLYQRAMDFAVDTDDYGIDQICDVIVGKLGWLD